MVWIPHLSAQLLDAEVLPLVVTISGRVSSETPINCEFSGLRGVIVEETVCTFNILKSMNFIFCEYITYVVIVVHI